MAETFDLVLRGGTVVTAGGTSVADVGVKDGRIARVGDLAAGSGGEVIDCRGLHILPGVMDTQVHFREPGAEHKEDLETGSRAAVLGGVTAVFEMPNTNPPTTSAGALADKVRRASGRMHCDFAFFVGGTRDNATDVGELERLPGAAGIKIFMGSSTGSLLVDDDETLRTILSRTKRRVSVHAEDEPRLRERMHLRRESDPSTHPVWRDDVAALKATERLTRVAEETNALVHLLHVSTADEIAFIRSHKRNVSVEITPQHLTFSADDYARLGTRLQMNPPVRAAHNRAALWEAIADGTADVLGSDHAPHTLEEKAKPYPASPSGMPGVQTLLPVMLDHVAAGRLSLERLVDLTSAGPARIFRMAGKGAVEPGYDADFSIVDLARRETITDAWSASRSAWTPYAGMTVRGWPVGTIVRGCRVMWDGALVTTGGGQPVRFHLP